MRILYFQNSAPLSEFTEACLSLTPKIATYTNKLFLDIGATKKALGGESRILKSAAELIELFELDPQIVVTDRPEWAQSLALNKTCIFPPGQSRIYFLRLPIERLTFCGPPDEIEKEKPEREDLVRFMRRVGMATIEHFTALSPLAINRRFGKMGCSLREWADGEREFVLPTFFPSDPIRETIDAEDIPSMEHLLFSLRHALCRIEVRLSARGMLARSLAASFSFLTGPRSTKNISFSEPMRSAQALLRLLNECLNGLHWESPLHEIQLEITDMVPYVPGQLSLFDDHESKLSDIGEYIARLKCRFGESSVGFAKLTESYLPERSWKATFPPELPERPQQILPRRPSFILASPRPYIPAKNARLMPSEHLAAEWWEEDDRQYFILETPEERLWVYWNPFQQQWFLHGVFD